MLVYNTDGVTDISGVLAELGELAKEARLGRFCFGGISLLETTHGLYGVNTLLTFSFVPLRRRGSLRRGGQTRSSST